MSLFNAPSPSPSAVYLADLFRKYADTEFQHEYQKAKTLIDNFWNHDSGHTGIDFLQALGTDAEKVVTLASGRVQMLLNAQAAFGRDDLVDLSEVTGPYDLTFNADGSLATWTAKA